MRLFVGVPLPESFRTTLEALQKKLSSSGADLTLVHSRNFHFTLKFLGDVADPAGIISRLEKVKSSPFPVTLSGIGVFPSQKFVRVVWVGTGSEAFVSLARDVQEKLQDVRKEEYKDVVVHLTLARVRSQRNREELLSIVSQLKSKNFGSFVVDRFVLYESLLQRGGPAYRVVKEFPL